MKSSGKIVKVFVTERRNGSLVNLFKERKPKGKQTTDNLITNLKGQKKDFQVVENGVEKTYKYSGNNYTISSKSIE